MRLHWRENASIQLTLEGGSALLCANADGLRTLAEHLLTLADAPPGSHIHYDENNGLEDGSAELVVERAR